MGGHWKNNIRDTYLGIYLSSRYIMGRCFYFEKKKWFYLTIMRIFLSFSTPELEKIL